MIFNSIGIWGFGAVGKALAAFLHKRGIPFAIMENRRPTEKEAELLAYYQTSWLSQQEIAFFCARHDYVVPSPGIALASFGYEANNIIGELDLFQHFFKKPIIAVTGTTGKTTVATYLADALEQSGIRVALGGNIGNATFNLIEQQEIIDYAVIEVSSFQLESTKFFAPDLAIWTNFYHNHLDYHGTMRRYFQAKCNIFVHQRASQKALLPLSCAGRLRAQRASHHVYFTEQPFKRFSHLPLYYIEHNAVIYRDGHKKKQVGVIDDNDTDIIFKENLLCLHAALDILGVTFTLSVSSSKKAIAHRLELVGVHNTIAFYNDSKATVPASTYQAVTRLQHKGPVILFLGGLSKGTKRQSFIKQLKNKIFFAICFGSEARQLHAYCQLYGIPSQAFDSLESAFAYGTYVMAEPKTIVLFSPSGASFDLFAHYQERGNAFKKLVYDFAKQTNE